MNEQAEPPCMWRTLLLGVLLAIPAGVSQHAHGGTGQVVLAHDVAPDGQTYVGNPVRFTSVVHGGDGIPDVHQDVPVRVRLNNVTLWETTAVSGHDYDGMAGVQVAFPVTGRYVVEALDGAGNAVASFAGFVEPMAPDDAHVELLATPGTPFLSGHEACYAFHTVRNGSRLHHTDARVEVRREGTMVLAVQTHTHEESQAFCFVPQLPGSYDVRILAFQAYPTADGARFAPTLAQDAFVALPDAPAPSFPLAAPSTDLNQVHVAGEGAYRLVGTYDPFTVVSTETLLTLSGLVVDAGNEPVQHVDFTAEVTGPGGLLWTSASLHEYDGIHDVRLHHALAGQYTAVIRATRGNWTAEVALPYTVLPPLLPTNLGQGALSLAPVHVQAGVPAVSTFAATTTGERPFAHAEVGVAFRQSGATVPVVAGKLHSHDDGLIPFLWTAPTVGSYDVDVDLFPLSPEAAVGEVATFRITAAAGPGIPMSSFAAAEVAASAQAPGAGLAVALAGLFGALWVTRQAARREG